MSFLKPIFKSLPSRFSGTRRARQKKFFTILLVVIVFGALLLPGSMAEGENIPGTDVPMETLTPNPEGPEGMGAFEGALAWLFLKISELLGWILAIVIDWMVGVAGVNDFLDTPAVNIGWAVVRDICNLFFVIILLLIAIGTILNIQTYHYRNTLGRFILMVILINFSKLIAGFFIDMGQVVMLTFVNQIQAAAANNLAQSLGVESMLKFAGTNSGVGSVMLMGLFAIVLLFVAIVVILVIDAILIGRIIALWILVVLSPLAYFLNVIPATKSYASKWWQSFSKYVVIGPVLAFFVWLALTVMSEVNKGLLINAELSKSGVIGQGFTNEGGELKVIEGHAFDSKVFFNYIVTIGLLIGALMAAQQGGVMGSQLAGKAMGYLQEKGMAPFKGALGVVKGAGGLAKGFVGRKAFLETPLRVLTPTYWKGFGQRAARLTEEARRETGGAGEQLSERIFKGGKAMTPRREMAERSIIDQKKSERMKEGAKSKEKMKELARRAWYTRGFTRKGRGGPEGERERTAILELSTELGNLDDVYEDFLEKGEITKENAEKWGFDTEMGENFEHLNDRNFKTFSMKFLGLDRNLYDPEKIFRNKNKELFKVWRDVDESEWTEEQRGGITSTLTQARSEALTNAQEASGEDKTRLRTMYYMSQQAREVGHWEQTMAGLASDGTPFIMDTDQMLAEVAGEAAKRNPRAFYQSFAPHNIRTLKYDSKRKVASFTADPSGLTRYQKGMSNYLEGIPDREYQHAAPRVHQIIVGSSRKIPAEEALVDEEGKEISPEINPYAKEWSEQNRKRNPRKVSASMTQLFGGGVPREEKISQSEKQQNITKGRIAKLQKEIEEEKKEYKISKSIIEKEKEITRLSQELIVNNTEVGKEAIMGNLPNDVAGRIASQVDLGNLADKITEALGRLEGGLGADLTALSTTLGETLNKVSDEVGRMGEGKEKDNISKGLDGLKDAVISGKEGKITDYVSQQKYLQAMKDLLLFLQSKKRTP